MFLWSDSVNGVHYEQIIIPLTSYQALTWWLSSPLAHVPSLECLLSPLLACFSSPLAKTRQAAASTKKKEPKGYLKTCPFEQCFCYTNMKSKCLSHYLWEHCAISPSPDGLLLITLIKVKSNLRWRAIYVYDHPSSHPEIYMPIGSLRLSTGRWRETSRKSCWF